jgi:histone deacetylase 1/2
MEVIPTTTSLFLSQHKYIRDLLTKMNMHGAKKVTILLSTTTVLKLIDGTSSVDCTEYKSVIGAMQYLSLTRPDISFAVNKLSQFMHKPTAAHWTAAKRLLRYLKHTIFHGIHIRRNITSKLITYYDVDWAGNCDDRRSTSAYICFLSSNLIS